MIFGIRSVIQLKILYYKVWSRENLEKCGILQMSNYKKIAVAVVVLFILWFTIACSAFDVQDYFINNHYAGNENENFSYANNENHEADHTIDETNLAEDISAYVENIMEKDALPGAAIALVQGDEIIFAQGYGFRDVVKRLPVTTETLFHIGSTNKSFNAMMVATLVDEGIVDWDTPVIEYYPDFELSSQQSTNSVTFRHLLTMQSGIPDTAEDDFDIDRASSEDVFDYVQNVRLFAAPGEEFSYSNISASLAGYLAVIASGEDYLDLYSGYEQLLMERVLDPIGMDSALIRASEAQHNPNYGKSYWLERGKAVEADPEDFDGDALAPSGALKVNVLDMAAYISTQLGHGVAPNRTRVVSEENLLQTWQPGLENYAMGWDVSSYKEYDFLSHEGAFDNYLCVIGFVPDLDIGFVILTNSEEAGDGLIEKAPKFLLDLMLK